MKSQRTGTVALQKETYCMSKPTNRTWPIKKTGEDTTANPLRQCQANKSARQQNCKECGHSAMPEPPVVRN